MSFVDRYESRRKSINSLIKLIKEILGNIVAKQEKAHQKLMGDFLS